MIIPKDNFKQKVNTVTPYDLCKYFDIVNLDAAFVNVSALLRQKGNGGIF